MLGGYQNKNLLAYSGITSKSQSYQALDTAGTNKKNNWSHHTTNIPASSFQNQVEMLSTKGTLYTISTPVLSAHPYHTISVQEISSISCPDQDTSDFSPVSSNQDTSELLTAIQDKDENNCCRCNDVAERRVLLAGGRRKRRWRKNRAEHVVKEWSMHIRTWDTFWHACCYMLVAHRLQTLLYSPAYIKPRHL